MAHPLNEARDAANSIDTSEITTEILSIDTVDDSEYDERVTAYVEINHPELEHLVAKYDVTRGCIPNETDEVSERVEYYVNPDTYDLSSLVTDTDLSLKPREYLADTDDALIDGVRASIRHGPTEVVVDDLLDDAERAYWILSCTNDRDPRAIVDYE